MRLEHLLSGARTKRARDKKDDQDCKEEVLYYSLALHFSEYETIYRNNSITAGSEARVPPYSTPGPGDRHQARAVMRPIDL